MFADPQSITVNAVAQSMPAIAREGKSSTYSKSDGSYEFQISHNIAKSRERHLVKFIHRKTTSDPLIPTNNIEVSATYYLVIDNPVNGVFTDTELGNDVAGLVAWLGSTNVGKVLGLES